MFSSGKKSKGKSPRSNPKGERNEDMMNMFGLGMPMEEGDDDDDDESLEAELAALQGRPAQRKGKPKNEAKLMSMDQISQLVSESMKDVDNVSDEDLEDDEDLMAELHELVPEDDDEDMEAPAKPEPSPSKADESSGLLKVILDRRELYAIAIEQAKAEGASSKARRYDRGLKELDKLAKDAKAGKSISEDDIPPPVAVKNKPSGTSGPSTPLETVSTPEPASRPEPAPRPLPTQRPSPAAKPSPQQQQQPPAAPPKASEPATVESGSDNQGTLTMLTARKSQYKMAALEKKKAGDITAAKHFLAISKQFDPVIEAIQKGESVDLSGLPPPPGTTSTPSVQAPQPSQPELSPAESSVQNQEGPPPKKDTGPPPPPSTVLEALQQRLEKYQTTCEQAKAEGNGSKARRMGRIAKQYEEAIRDHKKGKPIDFEELPTPPGFGPIPVGGSSARKPEDTAGEVPMQQVAPTANVRQEAQPQREVPAGSSEPMSRNEKELQFLLQRQKEFKMAALQAKKQGDIDAAKDYLRQAKGLDQMIAAAQNGMRVDITGVPSVKPNKQKSESMAASTTTNDSYVHVEPAHVEGPESGTENVSGDVAELYQRLEAALRKQVQTAKTNADHYKLLGDLSAAKNFESLGRNSQQDLDTLRISKAHGDPVPKFHYEMKSFPIVRSHPELSDSEAEVTITRCINVPLPSGYQPKDMYIYVNYEFPYPSDEPQKGYTNVVKHTINPEFSQTFKVTFDRKSRATMRIFRRQGLTFTVMYQRGFLKSDKAIGQATLKLEQFSNKCTIHECIDLMDMDRGRKPVGGKIEAMVKIREPLVDKDAEVVNEKWLMLDTHLRTLEIQSSSYTKTSPTMQRTEASGTYQSLEVLKFEKDLAEKQVSACKSQGKNPPPSLIQKIKNCQSQMQSIQTALKQDGATGIKEYLKQLECGLGIEKSKAQKALQTGDKTEAKLCLARKKLLDKEIAALKQRIGAS